MGSCALVPARRGPRRRVAPGVERCAARPRGCGAGELGLFRGLVRDQRSRSGASLLARAGPFLVSSLTQSRHTGHLPRVQEPVRHLASRRRPPQERRVVRRRAGLAVQVALEARQGLERVVAQPEGRPEGAGPVLGARERQQGRRVQVEGAEGRGREEDGEGSSRASRVSLGLPLLHLLTGLSLARRPLSPTSTRSSRSPSRPPSGTSRSSTACRIARSHPLGRSPPPPSSRSRRHRAWSCRRPRSS